MDSYNTIRMSRRILLALLICFTSFFAQAASKPDIFLVSLHSTRADAVGFTGSRKGVTPKLDRVAAGAIVFKRAYAQEPLTLPSLATLLTGQYPQAHEVSDQGVPLPAAVPFLPQILHSISYRTAAFVGSSELDPRAGLAPGFMRGFDTLEAPRSLANDVPFAQKTEWTAAEVVRRATAWLPTVRKGPVFVWIALYPSGAAAYDRQIAGLDAAAGKFIQALQARHMYDDAVIVIAADHGEALGAHGEKSSGAFLYDDTIQVPLLMKLPHGGMSGHKVSTSVGLVDVAPSILEAAGVAVPPRMQGRSLLRIVKSPGAADQAVYSRTDFPRRDFGWSALESWRSGNYLLIRAPRPELYDLAADPGATNNLAGSRTAVLDTLTAQLENFDRRITPGASTTVSSGLTSAELQKLSSLGYVGLQRAQTTAVSSPTGTDPKDKIAVINRVEDAMAMLHAGKAAEALPILEKVTASNPEAYLAFYGAALAHLQQKQYPAVIEALHQAIALQPDSALAQCAMGIAASRTGDWKTAATHLEIAAARLPESPLPHELLATAYSHLGRHDDAAREKLRAAQLQAGS